MKKYQKDYIIKELELRKVLLNVPYSSNELRLVEIKLINECIEEVRKLQIE